MSENKGIHDGHRNRVKKRFVESGLDNFFDHQVLELMLFYGIPRKDTNIIAHKLLDSFGSFSAVLDAPLDSLQECGLSYNCAVMLKLIPSVCSRYYGDKYKKNSGNQDFASENEILGQILPSFIENKDEQLFAVFNDARGKMLFKGTVSTGIAFSSDVSVKKLMRLCVQHKAKGVILAHNHMNGVAQPSQKEIDLISTVKVSLRSIGIILLEYFIVADMKCIPMSENEEYEHLFF